MNTDILIILLPIFSSIHGLALKYGFKVQDTKFLYYLLITIVYTIYLLISMRIQGIKIYFTCYAILSAIFFGLGRIGLTKLIIEAHNVGIADALYRCQIAISAFVCGLLFNTNLNIHVVSGILLTFVGFIILNLNQAKLGLDKIAGDAMYYGSILSISDILAEKCLIEKMPLILLSFIQHLGQLSYLFINYLLNAKNTFKVLEQNQLYIGIFFAAGSHILWDLIINYLHKLPRFSYAKSVTLASIIIVALVSHFYYKQDLSWGSFFGVSIIVTSLMFINFQSNVGTHLVIF